MYKVVIYLEGGKQVETVKHSILSAAAFADSYREQAVKCDIKRIEGGEDDSNGQVDKDCDGHI